ncbi:MAG: 30S ribosomal protein S19 [Candidatus Altiarchaeota archaeon]|nr:30S ribosomal protein S19 [Candidatus Altiarchaeota archaeon]
MMVKEYTYRGKTEAELAQMGLDEFIKIVPSRMRRTLKRGFTPYQKRFLEKVKIVNEKGITKPLKTQCRDMPVVPSMVGLTIMIYSGKEYKPVLITAEMLGHFLGEFSPTRKRIAHSAPGVGATRSSKFVPLK